MPGPADGEPEPHRLICPQVIFPLGRRGEYVRSIYLTTMAIGILLACGTSPPSEALEKQDAHKPEFLITPDVVYGHKFGMALTFDVYQPQELNGAAVIFVK